MALTIRKYKCNYPWFSFSFQKMPRIYIRKKEDHGKIPHELMMKAVNDVNDGMSVRKAAKTHNIPRGTLRNNLKKTVSQPGALLEPNYGHSRIFTDAQEAEMEIYLLDCSARFHGLTAMSFRMLVYALAKENKLKFPTKWNENNIAGKEWFMGFMKRHQILSIRTPEATSINRAFSFNRYTVGLFFDNLEQAYRTLGITGRSVFNLDETGVKTVHDVPKTLAKKGVKQLGQITSGERGELVTMCCTVSAVGVALPPVFVFPRKNFKEIMMLNAPEGSLGLVNPSGWMTAELFECVIEHLIMHTRPSVDNPIIITMDNHESHVSYEALKKAKDKHIHVITLPPHTSNKTQPLDRTVFGPFKAAYNKAVNSWMFQNPGKRVTIYVIPKLANEAFIKAFTLSNIMSGFKASGVWPLNRDVFDSEEFMPADVTDQPQPEQPSTPSVVATCHQPQPEQPSTSSVVATSHQPEQPSTSSVVATSHQPQPEQPSTSSVVATPLQPQPDQPSTLPVQDGFIISPRVIQPLPKVSSCFKSIKQYLYCLCQNNLERYVIQICTGNYSF